MKKIYYLLTFVTLLSCNKKDKAYNLYECSCPKEISDAGPNQNIYWDCSWQASYNNGKVKLITDKNGKLIALSRTSLNSKIK